MVDHVLDITKEHAARRILKKWRGFRDRRVFAYLRHAVCRAEDSLTHQVLRKISPIEAFILRDPTLHARLRFRFGGSSFPPVILYKIFVNANVQYVAGTTQILAGSKAAHDACDRMGERKYFDLVLADIENCTPLADSRLVEAHDMTVQARLKEHGQGDQHPIWLGGRGNSWRMLIDDKYSFNENVLRFDASQDLASGKSGKLMAAMLQTIEQSVLAQHAQTTVPFNRQYASKETLDRIKTSQARARSRGMHNLYTNHLRSSQDGIEAQLEDDSAQEAHAFGDGAEEAAERWQDAKDTTAQRSVLSSSGLAAQGSAGSHSHGDTNTSSHSASRWSSSKSPRKPAGRSGMSPPRTNDSRWLSTSYNGDDGVGVSSMDDDQFDNVADSLLDWAGGLSFEAYHETWEKTAATIMPEPVL